jgi:hypothetical protein
MTPAQIPFTLPVSAFPPLAVGFFGLGTGYLIWGPEELFGYPRRSPSVDKTTGLWGIWMPGFMQFLTGVYLFVGLAWFHTFREPPLYMAALAFTAYGVHWFAIGGGRYLGSDPRPNGFMAIAFALISVLGIVVFFRAGDWPVGVLFCGLTAIYVSDVFASFRLSVRTHIRSDGIQVEVSPGERALGLFHLLTGLWLMYLTWAAALKFASHVDVPL